MKGIVILLVIILILGGFLAFQIFKPENSNTSSKQMSKEEVIQILEKGTQYDNYILKYKVNKEDTTKMVKGNIITTETPKMYIWNDLNTGERIVIQYDTKIAIIAKKSTTALIPLSKALPLQEDITKFINNPESNYKYLKEETYKGIKCLVIQFKMYVDLGNSFVFTDESKDVISSNNVTVNVWIDSLTGLVLKFEGEAQNADGKKLNTVQECDIKLNTVTDSDVKRPNLNGYKVTDLDNV